MGDTGHEVFYLGGLSISSNICVVCGEPLGDAKLIKSYKKGSAHVVCEINVFDEPIINIPPTQQKKKKHEGLMTCHSGNHAMTIIAHYDNMWFVDCRPCNETVTFWESHPYFNHIKATRNIGEVVTLPKIEEEPEAPQAPKLIPDIDIGNVKIYSCKDCKTPLTQQQAEGTFKEVGKALCPVCYGSVLS